MNRWLAGADIGGTRTKIGLVDKETLEVAGLEVFPTEKYDRDIFMEQFLGAVERVCRKCSVSREELAGIGIGIGSYVFEPGGIVDSTWGYIPCLDGVALGDEVEKRLGISCAVDNDLRAIALAESRIGAGKEYSRVLSITLGTGVGVCLTVDGKFVEKEAVTHLAGHIMVRGKDEWVESLDQKGCYCPIFGCMENTCSATALEKMAREMVAPDIDNIQLFRLAREGRKEAKECLQFFFDCLLRGLNQMVYIFSPDVIVLGGGITKGFGPYGEELGKGIKARVHSRQRPELSISRLEENSGIIGAALLWLVEK